MLNDKDKEVYKNLFFPPQKTQSGMIRTGMGLMPVSYMETFNNISAAIRILHAASYPDIYVSKKMDDKKTKRQDFLLADGRFENAYLDNENTSSIERLEHIQELLIKFFEAKRKDDFLFENYDIVCIDNTDRDEICSKIAGDISRDVFCQKLSIYAIKELEKSCMDLKLISPEKANQLMRIKDYLMVRSGVLGHLTPAQRVQKVSSATQPDILEALDYYNLIRRYGKTQIGAVLAHRVKQIRNFENNKKRLLALSSWKERQRT
ncbi:MAG: hypothetical protein E7013_06020 [Alphaproteobacteria bacterium]|nr:hypothetical protein [Alphaproteobacteria bacterium]